MTESLYPHQSLTIQMILAVACMFIVFIIMIGSVSGWFLPQSPFSDPTSVRWATMHNRLDEGSLFGVSPLYVMLVFLVSAAIIFTNVLIKTDGADQITPVYCPYCKRRLQ